jgi:hypothetical protein
MDEPKVNPPLGPGDDDPRSPAGHPAEPIKPLGPGDDDPRTTPPKPVSPEAAPTVRVPKRKQE